MTDDYLFSLHWTWQKFDEIRGEEMYEILALRQRIFVVEQQCVYQDADELDRQSFHLSGRAADGRIVVYLRLLQPGTRFPEPSFGRVLTAIHARGKGLATDAVERAIIKCSREFPEMDLKISAQVYLKEYYARFGFTVVGEVYDEDGIDHLDMVLKGRA